MRELIQWIGVGGCCFILGMNVSFLTLDRNVLWRWFIVGKSFLTIYIALDIFFGEYNWFTPFAIVGILITSFTLAKAWHLGRIPTPRNLRYQERR